MTIGKEREFWEIPLDQLLVQLGATPQGLTTAEAGNRLRRFGPNSLARESRFAFLGEILRLLANPLVLVLLGAAIVSAVTRERVSGGLTVSEIPAHAADPDPAQQSAVLSVAERSNGDTDAALCAAGGQATPADS